MASLPNSKIVTYEEWLRMPVVEDEIEEVVNGEIRLMPPNKLKHAQAIENLHRPLHLQLDPERFTVLGSTFGLIIRKHPLTSRVPDLAVFENSTLVERDGYIHSAPSLVVEVMSPANRKRQREEKLADYASLGVPEVWLVWLNERKIEVFLLENGKMHCAQVVSDGVLRPGKLPGVEIAVPSIWPK